MMLNPDDRDRRVGSSASAEMHVTTEARARAQTTPAAERARQGAASRMIKSLLVYTC